MKLNKQHVLLIISAVVLLASFIYFAIDKKQTSTSYILKTKTETETSTTATSETTSATFEKTTASSQTVKTTTSQSTTQFSFPIEINLATYDMLCSVSGIGDVTANNILSYREQLGGFSSMDELLNVDGIGDYKLSVLKQYFYVENDSGTAAVQNSSTAKTTVAATAKQTVSTTTSKTATTTTTTTSKQRHNVNINTDSAEELAGGLLISDELAAEIVRVRELIGSYTNIRELLMCDGFSDSLLVELDEYIGL